SGSDGHCRSHACRRAERGRSGPWFLRVLADGVAAPAPANGAARGPLRTQPAIIRPVPECRGLNPHRRRRELSPAGMISEGQGSRGARADVEARLMPFTAPFSALLYATREQKSVVLASFLG